jgi:4-phospho-D-threonate 3-dehydrogenase / 4-phospho-D-erythronate 3-dehydrogenase
MNNTRPIIAVTVGDPAGIGPEIALKALSESSLYEICRPVVIGGRSILERARDVTGCAENLHQVEAPENGLYSCGTIDYIDVGELTADNAPFGAVNGRCGDESYLYVEKAVELAMAGQADAVTTGPINKESLDASMAPFVGHTEILGRLTQTEDPLTMFEVDQLRVFFLSRHVSLRHACDMVRKERILEYCRRCLEALRSLGIPEDKPLAVAGLNPHCGEHGLFGSEEDTEVTPAVREAQAMGLPVAGPIGADSVFYQALQGRFSAVLSLYHDQGHIATKTYSFERTISVTLGMPILRTSVDHGTAFDIAGTGTASSVSMSEAIRVGARYAPFFRAG